MRWKVVLLLQFRTTIDLVAVALVAVAFFEERAE